MRKLFFGFMLACVACTGGKHYSNLDGVDAALDAAPEDAACGDLCDAYCLRGTLTVTNAFDTVNGNPSTMAFEHLEGNPTDYRLVFDVKSSTVGMGDGSTQPQGLLRVLSVRIRSFSFADNYMNNVYGAAYAGMDYNKIILVNGSTIGVSMANMVCSATITSRHSATIRSRQI